jgi:hypothetical protein
MAIAAIQLVQRYPVLYHMASFGSWPLIRKHGLLSTAALLDLFEVSERAKNELLSAQRRESVAISHPVHGSAILRDQKPLSEKNLKRCLTDCDPDTWYTTLNERVFFWLNHDRLMTLMSASEYASKPHVILEVESAPLVSDYESEIELAPMNTGNTRPFPHPRGRSTFRKMSQYPYEGRHKLNDYSAIVELTVLRGVPNIRQYLRKVEHAQVVDGKYHSVESLYPA